MVDSAEYGVLESAVQTQEVRPDRHWQEIRVFGRSARHLDPSLRLQLGLKRILDFTFAALALVLLSPLFLFLMLAIKLDSEGPVFFRQTRWGRGQQKIEILKFRSMFAARCDTSGVAQTIKADPRVTPFGALLRRSNLDELPQLINVLRGDMSLIGPRCHAIGMLAAGVTYEDLVPDYHERHIMRPGITGLAQMRGLRGPTIQASKARARIACDIYYVRNYSLLLDVKIILGTIRYELFGGSGY